MSEVILAKPVAAAKKVKLCNKCKQPGKTYYNATAVDCTDCIALASAVKWAEKKRDKQFGLI